MNQPISAYLTEHVLEHDAMHEKRRRGPERNQIRQRIEFAPERTLRAAHARHAPVEQIKNAGRQDEIERDPDFSVSSRLEMSASTIFVNATKPQNRLPAVSRFGRK